MPSHAAEFLRKDRAAIYFHARWSGPSVAGLRDLKNAVKARGIPEEAVSIIDIDDDPQAIDVLKKEGFAFGGWGEAVVIRSGKIRYFTTLGRGDNAAELRVARFLDEEKA